MDTNWIYLVFKNASVFNTTQDGIVIGRPIKAFKSIENAVAYLDSITNLNEEVWDEEENDVVSNRYDKEGNRIWIESRVLK